MISIIITHYKTPEVLKLCLKYIHKQPEEKEIIVVDSESDWQTKGDVIDKFKNIEYIPFPKNVGYTRLVNEGLKRAKGEYILIINADVIIPQGALGKLVNFLQNRPEIGIVGPKQLNLDGSEQQNYFRFHKLSTIIYRRTFLKNFSFAKKELARFLYSDVEKLNKKGGFEVNWLMGSSLFLSRNSLEKVGYLDERFLMYFQDTDWCRRFKEAGLKIFYFPEVTFYHYHQRGSVKYGGIIDIFVNPLTRIHILDAIKYFLKYNKLR